MKALIFLEDCKVLGAGGEVLQSFEEGELALLKADSARHWLKRGKARLATEEERNPPEPEPAQSAPTKPARKKKTVRKA